MKITDADSLLKDLNDGLAIPSILDDIESSTVNNYEVVIQYMEDYDTRENQYLGGRNSNEGQISYVYISPNFKDSVVLAHELLHSLLYVRGFPQHHYVRDEYKPLKHHIDIGKELATYVQHKYIDKYLYKAGLNVDKHKKDIWDAFLNEPLNATSSIYHDLLRAVQLHRVSNEYPKYKRKFIEHFRMSSEEIIKIYGDIKVLINKENIGYAKPISMFKTIVVLLNILDDYKVRELIADNVDLQSFNSYHPVYISLHNLNKPASRFFRYWYYTNKEKGRVVLKLIYLYQRGVSKRIAVWGWDVSEDEADSFLRGIKDNLSNSSVENYLSWLREHRGLRTDIFRS